MSLGHTYELIERGVIPGVKIGKSVRIPRAAFEEWLAERIEASAGALRPPGAMHGQSATITAGDMAGRTSRGHTSRSKGRP